METSNDLQELFGGIDVYIFDQLLKGRFVPGMRVLDAGCGSGRNLVYFLRNGYEVFGVDESGPQIAEVRRMAAALAPASAGGEFLGRVGGKTIRRFRRLQNWKRQSANSRQPEGK